MPSYQETGTASDLAVAVFCSGRTLTANANKVARLIQVGGTAGGSTTLGLNSSEANRVVLNLISGAGDPGATAWSAGNWEVRLNVTTANTNWTWTECYVCRISSSGTSLATVASKLAMGVSLGTTGVKTTGLVSGSAQSSSTTDRIAIVCVFSNAQAMANTCAVTLNQLVDTPTFTVPAAASAEVHQGRAWVRPRWRRPAEIIVAAAAAAVPPGEAPGRPIRRATPQRKPLRGRSRIVISLSSGEAPPPPTTPEVHQGVRRRNFGRSLSRFEPAPLYNSGGIPPEVTRAPRWRPSTRVHSRIVVAVVAAIEPAGTVPLLLEALRRPAPKRADSRIIVSLAAAEVPPGLAPLVSEALRRPPARRAHGRLIVPPTAVVVAVQPLVSRALRRPPLIRVRCRTFTPRYNSGGLIPELTQGIRRKPAPGKPSRRQVAPEYNSGGLAPAWYQAIQKPPRRLGYQGSRWIERVPGPEAEPGTGLRWYVTSAEAAISAISTAATSTASSKEPTATTTTTVRGR